MKILGDLVLIRKTLKEENVSGGGIVLPNDQEHYETPNTGVVIGVGQGKRPKLSKAGRQLVDSLQNLLSHLPYSDDTAPYVADAVKAVHSNKMENDFVPMQVKVGDTVLFSSKGHQKFRIDGEDLVALREDSILAVMNDRMKPTNC